jgi:hypothetical protein
VTVALFRDRRIFIAAVLIQHYWQACFTKLKEQLGIERLMIAAGGRVAWLRRDWDPDHQLMGKGVTLTEEELMKFKRVIK